MWWMDHVPARCYADQEQDVAEARLPHWNADADALALRNR